MTYYLESRQLVQQAEKALNEEMQAKSGRIVKGESTFLIALGIGLAVWVAFDTKNLAAPCFILAIVLLGCLLLPLLLRQTYKTMRSFMRTITLEQEKIQLRDWLGEAEREIQYADIERAEVVPLLGKVFYSNMPKIPSRYERMYFICLHTEYNQVEEGSCKEWYDKNKNLIMLPYEESAWDILSQHIPQEKMKSLEEATEFGKVKWRDEILFGNGNKKVRM